MQRPFQPYVQSPQLWACPADRGQAVSEGTSLPLPGTPSDYAAFGSSYEYRSELVFAGATLSSLSNPARTNLLFDSWGGWHGGSTEQDKRWNMLYCDGHVESVGEYEYQAAWAQGI